MPGLHNCITRLVRPMTGTAAIELCNYANPAPRLPRLSATPASSRHELFEEARLAFEEAFGMEGVFELQELVVEMMAELVQ